MSHPVPFLNSTPVPRPGGPREPDKEEQVSRYSLYAKLVMAVLVLGTLAVLLGGDPWGPG